MVRQIIRKSNFQDSDTETYTLQDSVRPVDDILFFATKVVPIIKFHTNNSTNINALVSTINVVQVEGKEVTSIGAVEPYIEKIEEGIIGFVETFFGNRYVIPTEITNQLLNKECQLYVSQGVIFFVSDCKLSASINGYEWFEFALTSFNEKVKQISIDISSEEIPYICINKNMYELFFKIDLERETCLSVILS